MDAAPARPERRRQAARAGAVGFALCVHALLLLAVLLAWRPAQLPQEPPALDMALPAPFPRVPAARVDAHRAGGSPASAQRKAAPSTPAPKPATVPPAPLKPPSPVEPLPAPAPTLVAPVGPALASPVTGAGASAATGEGTGTGSGPGGPGGPALLDPDWLSWFGPEEVERAYPLAAFKAGEPGRAVLSCLGLRDGRVKECRVLAETPTGEGFGRAALGLTRYCRFRPLKVDGRAVEARLRIPIEFSVGE